MIVKFMYNGIKVDGKLFKAHYSKGNYTSQSKLAESTITIYASEYESFPKIEGLQTINESDSMTDYFEKDRIRVAIDNNFYKEVNEAHSKMEEHRQKKYNKRIA